MAVVREGWRFRDLGLTGTGAVFNTLRDARREKAPKIRCFRTTDPASGD
jgi:hypothetical protein